jgi:hypothetical protein
VAFPERATSAISSMLAPSNPRSRNIFRAASRMRVSTSPASSLGGRPKRTLVRLAAPRFRVEALAAAGSDLDVIFKPLILIAIFPG